MGKGDVFRITKPVQKALIAMNALMKVSTCLQSKPKWQRQATLPKQAQPHPIGIEMYNVIREVWPQGNCSKFCHPLAT